MLVLLIADEAKITADITSALHRHNFTMHSTDLGEEGLDLTVLYDYNIILLGHNPSKINGFELLKKLRRVKVKSPIIVLSGSSSIEDKVKALNLGADDFLTKPVHMDELIARMNAVVRRFMGHADSVIQNGRLSVNITTRTVCLDGVGVKLTNNEYALIAALSLHKSMKLTREMLLNHLYDNAEEGNSRTIDVFVGRLRKKLGKNVIETIRGYGYGLNSLTATTE